MHYIKKRKLTCTFVRHSVARGGLVGAVVNGTAAAHFLMTPLTRQVTGRGCRVATLTEKPRALVSCARRALQALLDNT